MTGLQCGNPLCPCAAEVEAVAVLDGGPHPPRWFLVLGVVVALLASCSRACAQEAREGGVWLPLELSREVLAAYEEAPRLHARIRLTEEALRLRTLEGVELRAGLTAAEEEAHGARAALGRAVAARNAAEVRARRRLRLGLGAGLTAAVTGFLAGFLAGA